MQYLLASHNRGKCREYAQLLSSCGGEVLLPQDIGITLEPERCTRYILRKIWSTRVKNG